VCPRGVRKSRGCGPSRPVRREPWAGLRRKATGIGQDGGRGEPLAWTVLRAPAMRRGWTAEARRLAGGLRRGRPTALVVCALLAGLASLPGACAPEALRAPAGPGGEGQARLTSGLTAARSRARAALAGVAERPAAGSGIAIEACPACHLRDGGPAPGLLAVATLRPLLPPHADFRADHGAVACRACHVDGATGVGWREGDGATCGPCHGRLVRALEAGWHGRARGYWDARRGPRRRDTCGTCHDPHDPAPARRPPPDSESGGVRAAPWTRGGADATR
jgi:hypothetical protein